MARSGKEERQSVAIPDWVERYAFIKATTIWVMLMTPFCAGLWVNSYGHWLLAFALEAFFVWWFVNLAHALSSTDIDDQVAQIVQDQVPHPKDTNVQGPKS